jgi:hypothetical protein
VLSTKARTHPLTTIEATVLADHIAANTMANEFDKIKIKHAFFLQTFFHKL